MIETGRYKRPNEVPLKNRVCDLCGTIDNEIHFVVQCKKFDEPRIKMFTKLKNIFVDFKDFDENEKFLFIMTCDDTELYSYHSKRIHHELSKNMGAFITVDKVHANPSFYIFVSSLYLS